MSKAIKNTILISAGTTLSKILGFIREMAIAAFFGASYLVDAYLVALIIPQVLFSVINNALTTTVIPLVTEYKHKEGLKSVLSFLNTVTAVMVISLALLIVAGEFLAEHIVGLLAPGFSGDAFQLTAALSRIMFPAMLFMGLAGLSVGILQSQKRFLYPSIIGIPNNLIIIASVFALGGIWGIKGLAAGTLIGVVGQWLFQVPDLRKAGFKFKLQMDFSHPGFRKMGLLIIPVIIGSGASQLNLVVDRLLASGLVEGSISALHFAHKLNTLVFGIIAVAAANAMYPEFAEAVARQDYKGLINLIKRSLTGLLLVILPFTVGMILLREPIVRLAFERGAFNTEATALTVTALLFYGLGLPALSLGQILLRTFYSLQDTMTPMIIGIFSVGLNIVLNLILVRYMAHGGLALASSISTTASCILLLWYLRKKIGRLGGQELLLSGAKMTLATGIMGILVLCFYNFLSSRLSAGMIADLIVLGCCACVGAGVYFSIVRVLRIKEFDWLCDKIKMKYHS